MKEISNELFYKIGESSKDGYFIYNLQSESFIYFNAAFCNIWERDQASILNHPHQVFSCVHPDDKVHVVSCYEECLEDQEAKKYEFRLGFENGREKYVRASVYPFFSSEEIVCGITEDITLERTNKLHIEQINYRKNITLEVLSHDLKEPLQMMKLTASSMEKAIARTGDRQLQESLSFIVDMCERNNRLVRSLINHEFLKSSEIGIKKERVDLVWELKDALRYYRRSRLRDVRNFKFHTKQDRIYIALDSMKFLQVINNLVSNAIKFTDENGTIGINVEDLDDSVLISVYDDGRGIPENLRHDFFERGAQGLKSGLIGHDSGGLGMGIIYSIIKMHDGKIWFETEPGKGTTFFIRLPR